jgi:hypothetical protein
MGRVVSVAGPSQGGLGHPSLRCGRLVEMVGFRQHIGSLAMNHDNANATGLIPFTIDLTFEEGRRRAEVVAALGPDWDPVAALRGEDEAYALLYSGLDAEQQRTYDLLVAAGVLPGEEPGRAATH